MSLLDIIHPKTIMKKKVNSKSKKGFKKRLKLEMKKSFQDFINQTSDSNSKKAKQELMNDVVRFRGNSGKKYTVGMDFQDVKEQYKWLEKDHDKLFEMEFNDLKEVDDKLDRKRGYFKTALENPNLNRFAGVYPNEDTRIVVNSKEYINANLVKGELFNIPQSFIATQAPLPNTINSFWDMIWEYDSRIIVMFQEVENTPVQNFFKKCEPWYTPGGTSFTENEEGFNVSPSDDFTNIFKTRMVYQYWPENGKILEKGMGEKVSKIEIKCKTTVSLEEDEGTIIRVLLLKKGGIEREVTMFQYTKWPDMSVPNDANSFLKLVRRVNKVFLRNPKMGPILLHCIAGVGRTGTFACVSIVVSQMHKFLKQKENGKIGKKKKFDFNIHDVVKILKNQRKGMVQKLDQYKFCYKVIIKEAERIGII